MASLWRLGMIIIPGINITKDRKQPITWTARTSNFPSGNIYGVNYGSDGNWVVNGGGVGPSWYISTSTDAITWAYDDISDSVSRGSRGVDFDGTYWVISATLGGKIKYATDPTSSWTAKSIESEGDDILYVKYADSVWVAGGASDALNVLWTATDPTSTWTARDVEFGEGNGVESIAFGNSTWVSAGTGGDLSTASDPTSTWTAQSSGLAADITDVAYGNGLWVAVSGPNKIATSTNTVNWTVHTLSFGSSYTGIAYGGGVWTLVGYTGILATSTDPTRDNSWSVRTSGFGTSNIWAVRYANGIWVAVGDDGKISTAVNGV